MASGVVRFDSMCVQYMCINFLAALLWHEQTYIQMSVYICVYKCKCVCLSVCVCVRVYLLYVFGFHCQYGRATKEQGVRQAAAAVKLTHKLAHTRSEAHTHTHTQRVTVKSLL